MLAHFQAAEGLRESDPRHTPAAHCAARHELTGNPREKHLVDHADILHRLARRCPPPWSVEELDACFVVRDHNGQALGYVYFEDEPGRHSAGKSALLWRSG